MNIKSAIYESLSPRERIIAAIDADARGDDAEFERLKETCPKKTYLMTDADFSMPMLVLMAASALVEAEIRGNVINVLVTVLNKREDMAEVFLQRIANVQSGWRVTLEEMGIDPAAMAKSGLQAHSFISMIADFIPEECEPEEVNLWAGAFRSCLDKARVETR